MRRSPARRERTGFARAADRKTSGRRGEAVTHGTRVSRGVGRVGQVAKRTKSVKDGATGHRGEEGEVVDGFTKETF